MLLNKDINLKNGTNTSNAKKEQSINSRYKCLPVQYFILGKFCDIY